MVCSPVEETAYTAGSGGWVWRGARTSYTSGRTAGGAAVLAQGERPGWAVGPAGRGPHEPCLPSGARRPGRLGEDTLYLRFCRAHSVVPASCFLRQGSAPELSLRHRGLGPQVPREGPSSRCEGRGPGRQQPWEGSLPEPTPPHTPQPCSGSQACPIPHSELQLGSGL